jgi:hypothetical protein
MIARPCLPAPAIDREAKAAPTGIAPLVRESGLDREPARHAP